VGRIYRKSETRIEYKREGSSRRGNEEMMIPDGGADRRVGDMQATTGAVCATLE